MLFQDFVLIVSPFTLTDGSKPRRFCAEQYAVGFAKNNTELRDKVQKTLDEMREDGKFAEIAEKWDLTDSVID